MLKNAHVLVWSKEEKHILIIMKTQKIKTKCTANDLCILIKVEEIAVKFS